MKKILITCIAIFSQQAWAERIIVPITDEAASGNTAVFEGVPGTDPIATAQDALARLRNTIIDNLTRAEVMGFSDETTPGYESDEFDINTLGNAEVNESSVPLNSVPTLDEDDGSITFTFSVSNFHPGVGYGNGVEMKFTPVVDQDNYQIIGWKCYSALGQVYYGPGSTRIDAGDRDIYTKNLGYQFYGCEVMAFSADDGKF